MHEILRRLNSVTGMRGSLVVTPDGLPIAVDLPAGMDCETTSGLTASTAKLLGDWAQQAGAGLLSLGMIEARDVRLFVSSIAWGYLIGVAEKHCPIGEARAEMRHATTGLNSICSRLAHAVEEEEAAQATPTAKLSKKAAGTRRRAG
jgi:predicted regulator of Ras-like GTPase activity (Roadblock/LC7/MglB family)